MKTYPKIQGLYKRYTEGEKNGKFIIGQYSLPEFELLKDIKWIWTEKIDGTNIRCLWYRCPLIPEPLEFRGKTDRADMPTHLGEKLKDLITKEKMQEIFPINKEDVGLPDVCIYGEGYGYKIQSGGKYFKDPKEVDFILFDIKIGDMWLKREDIEDIAKRLEIKIVPIVGEGTIDEAIYYVKKGFKSVIGFQDFIAEGLVLRPKVELKDRRGNRIITKIKTKDFMEKINVK